MRLPLVMKSFTTTKFMGNYSCKFNSNMAICFFCVVYFTFFCGNASAANWTQLFKSQDLTYYVDFDSIVRDGEVIEAWTKTNKLLSTFNEPYYSIDFIRVRCNSHTVKYVGAMILDNGDVRPHGSRLSTVIAEDTIANELSKRFC